jgi:hypothetical protein
MSRPDSTCAAPASAHHHVGKIAYAIYGKAHSERLRAWNNTWLQGKPHVFVPDAPEGPWAALYKPMHSTHDEGTKALFRFRSDANLLWAVLEANASYPDANWIFAVDDDTMPFEHTLRSVARRFDAAQPVAIGWAATPEARLISRPSPCAAATSLCKVHRDYKGEPGCCTCPVVRAANGAYELDLANGRAHYRMPTAPPFFGGTGILLSRGLLDAIPARAWALCAQRLVCGPSDLRLSTCISSLAPSVCWVPVHENKAFMLGALDRPGDPDVPTNVWYNELWSVLSEDPLRGPRIVAHFSNRSVPEDDRTTSALVHLLAHPPCSPIIAWQAQQRCPWSMHKLNLACVPAVFHASRHCHSLPASSSAEPLHSPPCWAGEEQRERQRLRREFGWEDARTAPFEELFARESAAIRGRTRGAK